MPLKKGDSNEDIKANIRKLVREGHSRDEAIAIAMRQAGRKRRKY